jgi:hypothetical protein
MYPLLIDYIEQRYRCPETITHDTINDLDRQFLVAATVMGVSDACIGGAEG